MLQESSHKRRICAILAVSIADTETAKKDGTAAGACIGRDKPKKPATLLAARWAREFAQAPDYILPR